MTSTAHAAEEHLRQFARSFVLPSRRERWEQLLAHRSRKLWSKASQLMDDLDPAKADQVNGAWSIEPTCEGVFFDFRSEPRRLTLNDAEREAIGCDAIFSIVAGELAIHFSHEGWSWLCTNGAAASRRGS